MTAGNSTPLTDGAAAILLSTEDWARKKNLPILAYLTFAKVAAVNFIDEEGLLMAPAYAVSDMLKQADLRLQDFDFYEIHEAFAAQAIATLKAWQSEEFCRSMLGRNEPMGPIDLSKMNVQAAAAWRSAIRSRPRVRAFLPRMAKLLSEKGSGRGLISVCTAGGMGVTAILGGAPTASSRDQNKGGPWVSSAPSWPNSTAYSGTSMFFTQSSVRASCSRSGAASAQYRALTHGPAVIRGVYDDPDDPGAINHFQALSAALSATVGLGNIGGVALAIALGGPGAIFWMWVIGVPRHGDQAHRGHYVDAVPQHRRSRESARWTDVGRRPGTGAQRVSGPRTRNRHRLQRHVAGIDVDRRQHVPGVERWPS